MRRVHVGVLVLVSTSACTLPGDDPPAARHDGLAPRVPIRERQLVVRRDLPARLIVKFADDAGARARGGEALVARGETGTQLAAARHDIAFRPLLELPEAELTRLEDEAAARTGAAQPDLASLMIAEVPAHGGVDALREAARELEALPEVEFAWIEPLHVPPPFDIAPTTDSFVAQQTYRGAAIGIDIEHAWSVGARGAGIRIADCEYGWNGAHEDLNETELHPEPGQTPAPFVVANGWDEHGTAVAGILVGQVNDYGVSGMVPDAELYTFPESTVESGSRRVAAIAAASAASRPGDVVLLEMQTGGATGGYGPAEYNPAVWTVVKNATDRGVIVVAAAGNGTENLDAPEYASYRARGDSGAIIVGAGTANAIHERLSFSTYGSRVDVHGWGRSVVSTGYGSLITIDGDKNQRYSSFGGTSSASPIVTSAVAALQSVAVARIGRLLSPVEMRDLLRRTGTPQGGDLTRPIGPLPNVRAALAELTINQAPTVAFTSPSMDDEVSGTVALALAASDPDGTVARVEVELPDGTILSDAEAPFEVAWDTTAFPDGVHLVRARAFDALGLHSEETLLRVHVVNACESSAAAPGVPVAIPDNAAAGVRSSITLARGTELASLKVSLRIRHTYRGDLRVSLIAPDGSVAPLHNRTGGSADDLAIVDAAVPAFVGKPVVGTWTLHVIDRAAGDAGMLESWSLGAAWSCARPTVDALD